MLAQKYAMMKKSDTSSVLGDNGILDRNGHYKRRRRKRRRKRKKKPGHSDTPDSSKLNYGLKNPDFEYNYPDFYEEKNYIYIDDADVENMKLNKGLI